MVTKCGGVPLAIKEVGRQLARNRQFSARSEWEWEQLLESIDLGATLELLDFNYQKLDPELKSCFLHLASFKENATIRTQKLAHILAAGGKALGSSFLLKLAMESIIEVKGRTIYNEIKSFRINTILHRLSMKKAEEELGFDILRSNGNDDHRPSQSRGRPHHRVIHCSRMQFNYSTNQDKHLVSLFFHGGGYFDSTPSYWESFEQLRMLDFEDFGLKILPESIGTLMELRYLGLRNNYIKELSHSLERLKRLEVLDIALNFMVEVPDIIWEMVSLRHLYISDAICLKPLKIDALQNLETLTYISVHNWTYQVSGLQMMTSLRKLGIEELDESSDISKLFASLAKFGNLHRLILRGFRFRSMPCLDNLGILVGLAELKLDGLLARLPNAESFPPYIFALGWLIHVLMKTLCRY